ncbi:MAG: DUF6522 family protein [Xanthobacteraceae bacterium]|nr:DUF6522 family protein [Xanthobacteraceae bacterium]PWB60684.1 MAG: hypothetical protein C3F17_14085 [Bradyrhizobiaceae bacterium]
MQLERSEDGFCIEAPVLADLLKVSPAELHDLMRARAVTSVCERGEGEHAGRYRLTFFSRSRRVGLEVDESGRVVRRWAIDFGDRPLPRAARKPAGAPT